MKKIINILLGTLVAFSLNFSVANSAAKEVRIAFFLEWASPNQEDKVKGAFAKAFGVPVKWTNFATGGEMTEAMMSGDIDISYLYGMKGTTCVVANSAGISKANASQLEGKKVAVALGTMADYVFKETMRVVGADPKKMTIIDMVPEDSAVALANGDVAMSCLFGKKSIGTALKSGKLMLSVKEASDAGIAGIDVTSVTNKFMKENPGMVKTFLEITHAANDRYKAGKSDFAVIAKDATTTVADTKDQMASFGFPSTKEQKKEYFGKKGILMTYLNVMGNMFATAENPALKNYSKVVTTKYLP
jgi:taurine transport system substrate-binding protein